MPFWSIPRLWPGELTYVLAGGPSVRQLDLSFLRGRNVVVINSSYRTWPEAAALYFYDDRWALWQLKDHRQEIDAFRGLRITGNVGTLHTKQIRAKHVHRQPDYPPWLQSTDTVAGRDSGTQGLNAAMHLSGPATIVMLGFDMRPDEHGNGWHHDPHPVPFRESNYKGRFLPQYEGLYRRATEAGYRLLLGTPSAIDCIPRVDPVTLEPIISGGQDGESMGVIEAGASL